MNKWVKVRKNQISIALLGAILILLFNIILPGFEKLPYYRKKIAQLEIQKKRIERYSLHMEYHEKLRNEYKLGVETFQTKFQAIRDVNALQVRLGKLQRKHHLRIELQDIETTKTNDLFDQVIVKQRLKGGYPDHMNYLKALTGPRSTLVTTRCSVENLNPTITDPELVMTLEFKYILPKL